MIHFTILCVGKLKENYLRAAVADYVGRLSKYTKIDIVEVPEDNHTVSAKRIDAEGASLVKKIVPGSCVIALDLHGRELSSERLAEYIAEKTVAGNSDFTFVIGGSDGIGNQVTSRADLRLCLSPMTFPHQLTRLILAEQLYRAMKINNGEQYHK